MPTRRDFLAALAAISAAACSRSSGASSQAGASATASARRRLDRVGIQLYSVRTEVQRDLPGTLARLAQIGYKEVEFAGYFGRTPAETRQLLSQNGLTAPSTHIPYGTIRTGWDKALDDALARGHQYITIPWLPENVRGSVASWRQVAEEFNRAASAAKARGLSFAYHNHEFELKPVEGRVPLDILLESTDAQLVQFEMDVYWVTNGGGDPLAYLRRFPGRFPLLHVKDSAGPPDHRQTDVGAGTINFAEVFRLGASQGNAVKHAFVEHDQPPDPMAFARASFDYLSRLEF